MRSMPQPTAVLSPTHLTRRFQHVAGWLVGVCFAGVAATALLVPPVVGGEPGIVGTLAVAGIVAGVVLGVVHWERRRPLWFQLFYASIALLVTALVWTSGGAASPFAVLFFAVSAYAASAWRGSAWLLIALTATLHILPLGYEAVEGRAATQLLFGLPIHLAIAIVGYARELEHQQSTNVHPSAERDDSTLLRDQLTGLHTGAVLTQYMRNAPALLGAATPFSILVLGVDHWQTLCDKHDRGTSDDIIRQVAVLLRSHSRSSDTPARYDDQTYLIIFPGASAEIALRLGERIRTVIEQHRFWTPHSPTRIAINLSLGVAAFPQDGASPEELAHTAVQRMRVMQQAHEAPVHAAN